LDPLKRTLSRRWLQPKKLETKAHGDFADLPDATVPAPDAAQTGTQ